MSLVYKIYSGINAPVDYSAPVVTTAALTADLPALPPGSVATYVVRAFDTVSGFEDESTDARVIVKVGPDGCDVTGRPSPPIGLTARAVSGGTARVTWAYPPRGNADGFNVYLGSLTPDYSAPVAVVAYGLGNALSATITGLSDGVTYAVSVRAFNSFGEEQNATTASVVGRSTGPAAPSAVSGSAVP